MTPSDRVDINSEEFKSMNENFIDRMLEKHLSSFTTGDAQFYERLENDLDRGLFLGFFNEGLFQSVVSKYKSSEPFTEEEEKCRKFLRGVFNGRTLEEYLDSPIHFYIGCIRDYLILKDLELFRKHTLSLIANYNPDEKK